MGKRICSDIRPGTKEFHAHGVRSPWRSFTERKRYFKNWVSSALACTRWSFY